MDPSLVPPAAAAASAALCAWHPDRPATGVCARCGTFVCSGCGPRLGEHVLCQGCQSRLGSNPSALAVSAAILALAGPCVAFVPGFVGLGLAYLERSRIARGSSPAAGAGWANAARVLGWMNVLLAALAALTLLSGAR